MSTLGERLKESREQKGLYQSQLAELIGVKSAGVISNWEKDINKPNADKMVEICQVLGISLSYLLDYYGKEEAPLYSSGAMKLAEDYDSLDEFGREAVRAVADVEMARCATLVSIGNRPMIQAAARSGGVTEIENIDPDEISDGEIIP